MKHLLLYPALPLFILLFGLSENNAQGLLTEIGFNNEHDQILGAIACDETYSYLGYTEQPNSFFTPCRLVKIDGQGEVLWSVEVSGMPSEVNYIDDILVEDEHLIVSGYGSVGCDYGPTFHF